MIKTNLDFGYKRNLVYEEIDSEICSDSNVIEVEIKEIPHTRQKTCEESAVEILGDNHSTTRPKRNYKIPNYLKDYYLTENSTADSD